MALECQVGAQLYHLVRYDIPQTNHTDKKRLLMVSRPHKRPEQRTRIHVATMGWQGCVTKTEGGINEPPIRILLQRHSLRYARRLANSGQPRDALNSSEGASHLPVTSLAANDCTFSSLAMLVRNVGSQTELQ